MVLISIIAAMNFADLGIGNGLTNAISEACGKDDRILAREYITSAAVLMLAIAALLAAAGIVAYPFLPWTRLFNVKSTAIAGEGAEAFLVLYGSFIVNIPLGVIPRAQAGLQKGYSSQLISVVGSALSLAGMLAVIRLHGNLAWLVFASVFSAILATLFNGWLLFHEHPWLIPAWSSYRTRSAKRLLTLGSLFFVLQCAYALGFTSDNIVIAQVLGAAAVAAYAVPQKLFGTVSILASMAIIPLWPAYGEAMARGDRAWVRRVFAGSLLFTLLITIPLCTVLVVAGSWILLVFVGKGVHAPLSLLLILALWTIVYSLCSAVSVMLNGAGVLKIQAVVAVVTGFVNLLLSLWLTRRIGVSGVCLGSIITQLAITVPAYFVLIRRLFGDDLSRPETNDFLRSPLALRAGALLTTLRSVPTIPRADNTPRP